MLTFSAICVVVTLVCFVLRAVGTGSKVDLEALGRYSKSPD